jgi:hypothetical protein
MGTRQQHYCGCGSGRMPGIVAGARRRRDGRRWADPFFLLSAASEPPAMEGPSADPHNAQRTAKTRPAISERRGVTSWLPPAALH